ncbi:OLC1v1025107C2 [Oldenlandia corymbosa var. corymbosa]|uniref:OLC1v1025107C2 n=1 Tax=Oldenlandia corymbosa var. corymbosa TaxID=529605 RepID=A0AAV1C4I2_OLDCO|nr:OLC1v1025107C2 [Oldenlandia corymbosa var. corymbosa]
MAEQPPMKRSTTLNDLPNNLLIHILSFLPILSAIETSYISRKWRNLWHSLPFLHFDATKFDCNYSSVPEYHQRFAEFITQALLNRPTTIPLRGFRLTFYYSFNHRHRSLVSSYIRYALDCKVDVIDLDFDVVVNNNSDDDDNQKYGESGSKPLYGFHLCDLRNRSVKRLSLCRCELIIPSNDRIRLESLRDLDLWKRKFRVISESLRFLHLRFYFAVTDEEMESSIEIRTPNLAKLKIYHFYVAHYTGDLSSVVEADLWFTEDLDYSQKCWSSAMNLLRGVKNLSVQNKWLRFMHSKIMSNECFELKSLKHLELSTGFTNGDILGLSLLLKQSPVLETLVLDYAYQTEADVSALLFPQFVIDIM